MLKSAEIQRPYPLGNAFKDCHIVVSPIIFSDFNKFLLRILFLIKPVTTTYFFFKNAGPLKFWLGPNFEILGAQLATEEKH